MTMFSFGGICTKVYTICIYYLLLFYSQLIPIPSLIFPIICFHIRGMVGPGHAQDVDAPSGCRAWRAWCVAGAQRRPPPQRSEAQKGRIVADESASADSPKYYSINNCAVNSFRRCWPVYCWLMPMAFKLYSCRQSNTLMVLGKV